MSPSTFIQTLFPSMFHRRLLLLAVLMGMPMLPVAWRLSRLTLAKGTELREDAEKRLVRRAWTPTVRGSIIDAKGRVLAQDRPSYDVAVEYSVITGDWVQEQARKAARHAAGSRWADMSADQKADAVARFRPAYHMHLEHGWSELARRLGIPPDELDKRRDQVVAEVTSKQEHNTIALLQTDLMHKLGMDREEFESLWKQAAAGFDLKQEQYEPLTIEFLRLAGDRAAKIDAQAMKAIVKHATQPIAEQKSSQVLAWRVNDAVGFACRGLADEEAEVAPPDAAAGTKAAADTDLREGSLTAPTMPGLSVLDGGDRDYPIESATVAVNMSSLPSPLREEGTKNILVEGLAAHVLGRIRDRVQAEDPKRRAEYLKNNPSVMKAAMVDGAEEYDLFKDRGAYRDGDRVGDTGIESSQENTLRGLRGVQTSRLDSGERLFLPPVRGKDVQLTLDIMLQARVQAAMTPALGLAVVQEWQHPIVLDHPDVIGAQKVGTPLNGAAVVLDIDSGDILAMVSMPSYTREQAREDPESVFKDPLNVAYLNRCIAKPYPPGSIVKPLILNGAVQRGNFSLDQRIECTGFLFPNHPNMYRCWIFKQHQTTHSARYGHALSGAEGIMASCNVFFFTLGQRLGPEGIIETYQEFGVGDRFNLGVGQEYAGGLGKTGDGSGLKLPDAIQMGIGQGPVSWTPLHAAAAYATLARGGVRIQPRIIKGQARADPVDLGLNQGAVAEALEGLRLAVNDKEGTGNHLMIDDRYEPIFNVPGVKVWGKTGTAASSPVIGDPDGEGPEGPTILASGDHSWFVIMVGHDRPRYVISVVTDFGGSGGKVSGPIANQIIAALVSEGYL